DLVHGPALRGGQERGGVQILERRAVVVGRAQIGVPAEQNHTLLRVGAAHIRGQQTEQARVLRVRQRSVGREDDLVVLTARPGAVLDTRGRALLRGFAVWAPRDPDAAFLTLAEPRN